MFHIAKYYHAMAVNCVFNIKQGKHGLKVIKLTPMSHAKSDKIE